jgi:hypothetical protein
MTGNRCKRLAYMRKNYIGRFRLTEEQRSEIRLSTDPKSTRGELARIPVSLGPILPPPLHAGLYLERMRSVWGLYVPRDHKNDEFAERGE